MCGCVLQGASPCWVFAAQRQVSAARRGEAEGESAANRGWAALELDADPWSHATGYRIAFLACLPGLSADARLVLFRNDRS